MGAPSSAYWTDRIRSIVLISVNSGMNCGTGSFISTTSRSRRPLILTAAHLLLFSFGESMPTQQQIDEELLSWQVRFDWESSACDNPIAAPTPHVMIGVHFVSWWPTGNGSSDFLLVETVDIPPPEWDLYYNGWEISELPPSGTGACISHPRGDLKRICSDNQMATQVGTKWKYTWDSGFSENGSSGAPIFNSFNTSDPCYFWNNSSSLFEFYY